MKTGIANVTINNSVQVFKGTQGFALMEFWRAIGYLDTILQMFNSPINRANNCT